VQGDHGLDGPREIFIAAKKLVGLFQPSLGYPELGKPGRRMNTSSLLPALLELTEGPGEPSLSVIPLTCCPTHLRAASAAEREQIGVTGPLHESHDRAGPLLETAHVQGDFGGEVGRAAQITERQHV